MPIVVMLRIVLFMIHSLEEFNLVMCNKLPLIRMLYSIPRDILCSCLLEWKLKIPLPIIWCLEQDLVTICYKVISIPLPSISLMHRILLIIISLLVQISTELSFNQLIRIQLKIALMDPLLVLLMVMKPILIGR